MFLGWYDPDKKRPARAKLADAIERYTEKFGNPPAMCLTSTTDAAELATETKLPAPLVPIRAVAFVPRYTFYVGIEEHPKVFPAAA